MKTLIWLVASWAALAALVAWFVARFLQFATRVDAPLEPAPPESAPLALLSRLDPRMLRGIAAAGAVSAVALLALPAALDLPTRFSGSEPTQLAVLSDARSTVDVGEAAARSSRDRSAAEPAPLAPQSATAAGTPSTTTTPAPRRRTTANEPRRSAPVTTPPAASTPPVVTPAPTATPSPVPTAAPPVAVAAADPAPTPSPAPEAARGKGKKSRAAQGNNGKKPAGTPVGPPEQVPVGPSDPAPAGSASPEAKNAKTPPGHGCGKGKKSSQSDGDCPS